MTKSSTESGRILTDEQLHTFGVLIQTESGCSRPPTFGYSSPKVKSEIAEYNPHMEFLTYSTLACLTGVFRGVLNDGPPGIGKSRSTVELLDLLPGIEGVKILSGHASPMSTYKLLWECRANGNVLLNDEAHVSLVNAQTLTLLRSALYLGRVDWLTQGPALNVIGIPDHFEFEGGIVFNVNDLAVMNPHELAFVDRVMYHPVSLTGEQRVDKLRHRRSFKPTKSIWRMIRDQLLSLRSEKLPERLSNSEKDWVLEYTLNRIHRLGPAARAGISMRVAERVESVFWFVKRFFGCFDIDFGSRWADRYISQLDHRDPLVDALNEHGGEMNIGEAAILLSRAMHCSRRTAYRRIREAIEAGRFEGNHLKIWLKPPQTSVSPVPPVPTLAVQTARANP